MKSIVQVRKAFAARRRQLQKGLTLIEAAMVLGVAALVVAGVLALYSSANNANKAQEALNQLNILQQAVRNVYASQPDFNGLTTTNFATQLRPVLPNKMAGSGEFLSNAFNGHVSVTGNSTTNGFDIVFESVPKDACMVLLTKDYGRSLLSINTDTGGGETGTTGVPTATDAQTYCNSTTGVNIITWSFQN